MAQKGITYAESGVDIDREDVAIRSLVTGLMFRRTGMGAPIDLPGSFTGGVEFGDHILSLCTDGVGSKILIADAVGKWDTLGIDCMAMNANDMICIGAEPIAFVDYIAIDGPDPSKMEQIGIGLDRAAELANVSIIGGETATLPGIVIGFDLAGTCLGVVKKDRIITGQNVQPGDVLIGLASSGVHSNGFSLVRKAVEHANASYSDPFPGDKRFSTLGEALLEPTRIYVRDIISLVDSFDIHGMAHVTGGGLKNIARINPSYGYVIDDPLPVTPVFDTIRKMGNVDDFEMYRTFNMGMGYVIVAPSDQAEDIINALDVEAKIVGKVIEGSGVVFRDMIF
jgi:phosphoribosylformylglycinamidine cyclo-ligase